MKILTIHAPCRLGFDDLGTHLTINAIDADGREVLSGSLVGYNGLHHLTFVPGYTYPVEVTLKEVK